MARAQIDLHDLQNTAPDWVGYFIDAYQLMPAGGRVDEASVPATNGIKYLPSGSIVGRTQAEVDSDAPFRLLTAGEAPAGLAQVYLTAFEVNDVAKNADIELVRPHAGVIVKHNFLPNQEVLTALRTQLEARYNLVKGA